MASPRIPRQVPLPAGLSDDQLQEIEDTVFYPDDPKPSDILFVFGYSKHDWQHVVDLYKEDYAQLVLATGKLAPEHPECTTPQAYEIRDALQVSGVPAEKILVEAESTNTLENVIYGKRILEQNGISPGSILFAAKAHHSGRCARTLRKYFPDAEVSCRVYEMDYKDTPVRKSDWLKHPAAQERVYAEFLRIQQYSAKGDIAQPAEDQYPIADGI